jgi:hypothetical protein
MGHGLTGDPHTLCKGKTWTTQSKKAQIILSHNIAHKPNSIVAEAVNCEGIIQHQE